MYRRAVLPMIVDVVAHILDQFRNQMRADRFVLAAFNGNAAWTIIPRVGANSRKRLPL